MSWWGSEEANGTPVLNSRRKGSQSLERQQRKRYAVLVSDMYDEVNGSFEREMQLVVYEPGKEGWLIAGWLGLGNWQPENLISLEPR